MGSMGRQLGLEGKIWILTAGIAVLTVLSYLLLVQPFEAAPPTLDVPWWVVAGAFSARRVEALRGDVGGLGRAAAIVIGLAWTTWGYVVGSVRLKAARS